MAKRLGLVAGLLPLTVGACTPNPGPTPVTKWDPVCHCVMAQYSPSVSANYPPVETTRRGTAPAHLWPDPGPRANVPLNTVPYPYYPFPMVDVAESATLGVILDQREALEFFAVGPELGLLPPGNIGAGNIAMRVQDASGTYTGYITLPQGAATTGPGGGPVGTGGTRAVRAQRVSSTTAGTHTYLCAVDDGGHIDLAERRGQPAVDPDGAPLREAMKWNTVGANLLVIWIDLNERVTSAPSDEFTDVACAAWTNPGTGADELHILGTAKDGRVWHSLGSRATSDPGVTSFTPFAQVSAFPPRMVRLSAAAADNQLHVVALGFDQASGQYGQPWYTVRNTTGAWSPAVNVRSLVTGTAGSVSYTDVALGFCDEGVVAPPAYEPHQLNVALLRQDGVVDMTVHTNWGQGWGEGGATTTWLHGSQWDGELEVPASPVVLTPRVLFGISLSERPFPP